jgi:hypothetical protein
MRSMAAAACHQHVGRGAGPADAGLNTTPAEFMGMVERARSIAAGDIFRWCSQRYPPSPAALALLVPRASRRSCSI